MANDKAAERHLQKKRKADEMPTSPFASPGRGQQMSRSSMAILKAGMRSPDAHKAQAGDIAMRKGSCCAAPTVVYHL